MSLEVRPPNISDLDALEKLLNTSFQYSPGSSESYRVDFAPLFSAGALHTSRVIIKDGEVAASGALYPTTVVSGSQTYKAGIIGAIATAPAYRNTGLGTQIMQELEAVGRKNQCDFLVLWSDQTEFYGKLGFKTAGIQTVYALAEIIENNIYEKILRSAKGVAAYGWDLPQVAALYERHPLRCKRTPEYWAEIEKIRSCTRLQWLDPSGEVKAYIGFDRGKDLKGIVHEWGGDPDSIFNLVCTALSRRPDLSWLTHPALDDPFRRILQNKQPLLNSCLALFKPLSEKRMDFDKLWFWGLDSL